MPSGSSNPASNPPHPLTLDPTDDRWLRSVTRESSATIKNPRRAPWRGFSVDSDWLQLGSFRLPPPRPPAAPNVPAVRAPSATITPNAPPPRTLRRQPVATRFFVGTFRDIPGHARRVPRLRLSKSRVLSRGAPIPPPVSCAFLSPIAHDKNRNRSKRPRNDAKKSSPASDCRNCLCAITQTKVI